MKAEKKFKFYKDHIFVIEQDLNYDAVLFIWPKVVRRFDRLIFVVEVIFQLNLL